MKNEFDSCEVYGTDEAKVQRASEKIKEQNVPLMAKMFKALSDETRMKIALALFEEESLCVCDVASIIDGSNATASHHLRLLRKLGLAKSEKIGKMVYYSLDDEHVVQLIQLAQAHTKEGKADEC
ncbi:metalloregulator ArsR/SmtB family transcription factor [Bacillus tianshenii]|nr:metalloregulator ArsR/SmtB family transcription factor [Bacillus tianshenii]